AARAALLRQNVDGVVCTGSYAAGAKVGAAAGRKMLKLQLELGGKDPVYVCEDVDVAKAAASIADGAFYNTGQSCCSVERIYVNERIYKPFIDAFVKEVKGYKRGDPSDDATYIGPLIGIMTVKDDRQALELMNDTSYGLTAGVYTADRKRAEKILEGVKSGSVYWNCCDRVSPRLPWSGVGNSGIGLTLSKYGIET